MDETLERALRRLPARRSPAAIGRAALLCLALAPAVVGLLGAGPAAASVQSELAFHRGVDAFGEGDYDTAEREFLSILREDESDVASMRYLGLIYVARKDGPRALRILERATSLHPADQSLRIDLAAAQLLAEDPAAAIAELQSVLALSPNNAKARFYSGVALYRLGRCNDALPELQQATAEMTLRTESRYYIGLCEVQQRDFAAAEAALADSGEASPLDPLSRSASNLRQALGDQTKPWSVAAALGTEYDSNPTAAGIGLPEEEDFVGSFRVSGRYRALDRDAWRITLGYDGFLNFHADETAVDQQIHALSIAGRTQQGRYSAALRYDYSESLLDLTDRFRSLHRLTPSVGVWFGDFGSTTLFYQFQNLDFFGGIADTGNPVVDRALDRDGVQHTLGIAHAVPLPAPLTVANAGLQITRYEPDGSEFEYDGIESSLSGGLLLPYESVLQVTYRFIYRGYTNRTRLEPDREPFHRRHRRDQIHSLSFDLAVPLTKWLTTSFAYSSSFTDSNVPLFDFDRHLVGAYLRFAL